LSKGADSVGTLSEAGDFQGVETDVSSKVFRPVGQLLNKLEPNTVLLNPLNKVSFITASNTYRVACSLILAEPLRPNPIVKVVGSNSAMDGAPAGLRLGKKLSKSSSNIA